MKALIVSLCVVVAAFLVRADLLQNPSFEEQGIAPDLAAHWYRWGQWINREDSWAPTRTGKCMIGYHHWQIEDANDSGIWQDITGVKVGQRFKFSVFVWFDKTNAPAREVELRLEATRNGQASDHRVREVLTERLSRRANGISFPLQARHPKRICAC